MFLAEYQVARRLPTILHLVRVTPLHLNLCESLSQDLFGQSQAGPLTLPGLLIMTSSMIERQRV